MAYVTGIFQGKAKNVKVGETKTGKRKIDFDFILSTDDGNEEKSISVLLLNDEVEVLEDTIVRIEGKLELNIWQGNSTLKMLSSNVLENLDTEVKDGTIVGTFKGYPNFIQEKTTQNGKRIVSCSLSISDKDEEGNWVNDNISVSLFSEESTIEEKMPVSFEGVLNINTWEKEGKTQKQLSLLSFNKIEE